jgi:hypothetical protein
MKELGSLSVGSLLNMLHQAIAKVSHEIDRITGINEGVSTKEVEQLREHIEQRLGKGEDEQYNKEMLKVIDLFLTDKYVLDFIKEDSEEWLDFINAIKASTDGKGGENRAESKKLYNSITQLEKILRG